MLTGTFVSGDVDDLVAFFNPAPTTDGAPIIVPVSTGSPFSFSKTGLSLSVAAGDTMYLTFVAFIGGSAVVNHNFTIDGLTNPIVLTITGSPTQTNAQTNIGGTVTVTA